MRRVLLLATLLATPALARGQTLPVPPAGGFSFGTDLHSPVDNFINLDECSGDSPGTLLVRWDVGNASTTSTGAATSFTVYAHNSTSAHSDSSAGPCPTVSGDAGDTALRVGAVQAFDVSAIYPAPTDSTWSGPSNDVTLDPAIVASVSGKSCSSTVEEDIILCVQASNGATARGKVILSTRAPAAPTGVVAGSGSGALNVAWTATTGTPAAEYYVIEAGFAALTPIAAGVDPAAVPTVSSGILTATSYRLPGLIDGVVYKVWVYAFSTADNRSVHSVEQRAMPELARDFWTAYHDAGGREQGGCGIGTAGPVGLLVAAAALALARRRS